MSNYLDTIYQYSPSLIQNLMVTLYGLKLYRREYGPKFSALLKKFEEMQWLSQSELVEYQNKQLRSLIKHCYENVPYYRKIMDQRKLKPSDIDNVSDLTKLPIITRDDVKNNNAQMRAANFKKSQLIEGHTSGTTGSPLELVWDDQICLYKTAVDWRQKKLAGISPGDKMAFFLGRFVVPLKNKKPPFWRHNWVMNHLFCSSWHMSPNNLEHYFAKFKSFKPIAIEGYPSTIYILAQYLLSQKQTFPLKSVFTSSETLVPQQREAIEKAFECKLFDFYGMAERTVFATECEHHTGKHVNLDFGITEFIGQDGKPAEFGQLGRIVATSLHNYGMPFIRYQTSDLSTLVKEPCQCGRGFPLMDHVATKVEDIITTKDGRYISASILNALTHHLTCIAEHQIIQEDREHIRMRIVKRKNYNDKDSEFLIESLKKTFGLGIAVELEFVKSIPRTNAGKFRWIVSKVPLEF